MLLLLSPLTLDLALALSLNLTLSSGISIFIFIGRQVGVGVVENIIERVAHTLPLTTFFVLIVLTSSLLLSSLFPLSNTNQNLLLFHPLTSVGVDFIEAEPTDESFKDMDSLGLEVILVVVHPAEKGGNELRKVRAKSGDGKRDDGDLGETKSGFDNFSVFGGEEDGESREEFGSGLVGNLVYILISNALLWKYLKRLDIPLNSNNNLDNALMLALII